MLEGIFTQIMKYSCKIFHNLRKVQMRKGKVQMRKVQMGNFGL